MQMLHAVALFMAALMGGALNAVAGGGSFFTFPMLVFAGVPPIVANATSTVALWPGSIASVGAYRRELNAQRHLVPLLGSISLIGGIVGALLLLWTPETTFVALIPYLLLVATLLFALSPRITGWLRKRFGMSADVGQRSMLSIAILQLIIAIYGGYFGGGIGILMLAALALMGLHNIHEMNGLKTLLATCINGVAVLTFVIANAVAWPQAIVMLTGAVVGGYGGAAFARRLDPRVVRAFVIVTGLVLTIYFFLD